MPDTLSGLAARVSLSPGAHALNSAVFTGIGSLLEVDEERKKRVKRGKGDVSQGRQRGNMANGQLPPGPPRPLPKSSSSSPARGSTAGLSAGSQAAVVKLISYVSIGGSARNLVNYQSRGGTLALEDENGNPVEGLSGVNAELASWAQYKSEREPSKDIYSFTFQVAGLFADEAIGDRLKEALPGHPFAWRQDAQEDGTEIQVVMLAASSEKNDEGRRIRIYDTERSLDQLWSRLDAKFADQPVLAVNDNWSHGTEGALKELAWLTHDGQVKASLSDGGTLDNRDDNLALARSWKRPMRSQSPRDVAHVMFSSKPGTNREAFVSAVRDTLAQEFPNREYVFAVHNDTNHYHVHAAVLMEGKQIGQRLDPQVEDFKRWRETMAEKARERLIPMEATSRFEQANKPAYKLAHAKMAERGAAPDHVRRRVSERDDIHIPTRSEGRQKAVQTARAWSALKSTGTYGPEPAKPENAIRLYRAEASTGSKSDTLLFTNDYFKVIELASKSGAAITYVDIPKSHKDLILPSKKNPTSIFLLPDYLAERRQIFPSLNDNVIELNRHRTAEAVVQAEKNVIERTVDQLTRDFDMASASLLEASRNRIALALDTAAEFIRPDDLLDHRHRRQEIVDGLDAHIQELKTYESSLPNIEGPDYQEPKKTDIDKFKAELKGSEVHYIVYNETARRHETAFVDKGQQLQVHHQTDRDAIEAAILVSKQKWDTISLTGNDEYKKIAVEIAVKHNVEISNPELQKDIHEAKLRHIQETQGAGIREAKGVFMQEGAPQREIDGRVQEPVQRDRRPEDSAPFEREKYTRVVQPGALPKEASPPAERGEFPRYAIEPPLKTPGTIRLYHVEGESHEGSAVYFQRRDYAEEVANKEHKPLAFVDVIPERRNEVDFELDGQGRGVYLISSELHKGAETLPRDAQGKSYVEEMVAARGELQNQGVTSSHELEHRSIEQATLSVRSSGQIPLDKAMEVEKIREAMVAEADHETAAKRAHRGEYTDAEVRAADRVVKSVDNQSDTKVVEPTTQRADESARMRELNNQRNDVLDQAAIDRANYEESQIERQAETQKQKM